MQDDIKNKFISTIRKRSEENEKSLKLVFENNLFGQAVAILRQELDSMVRVIFLSNQEVNIRNDLANRTLSGEKWKIGREKITDRKMVDLTSRLNGWAQYVYKFGCSFIHLSDFHNYENEDPFSKLDEADKQNIAKYMQQYHGYTGKIHLRSMYPYLPAVFKKIKSNLECYLEDLESNFSNANWKIDL